MAWTYSDWTSQATDAARLTRLNLHITEVSDAVGREIDADGKRVSSAAVQQYLDTLLRQRERLESRTAGGSSVNGGVSFADFRRA